MILDPLDDDLDGSPLTEVLADPEVRVVVHAGRQDVALLRRRFRAEVTNVFDTQVAAGLRRAGRAELLRLAADRPAGAAAGQDGELHPLGHPPAVGRAGRLRAGGRGPPARARGGARRPPAGARQAAVGARGVRGGGPGPATSATRRRSCGACRAYPGLSARATAVARELVGWRESVAERQNRPVQSVLSDATLVELARRSPGSQEALGTDPGPRRGGRRPPRSRAARRHPAGHRAAPGQRLHRPPAAGAQARRPAPGGARGGTRPGPRTGSRTGL